MRRILIVNLLIILVLIVGLSQLVSASQPEPPTPTVKANRQTQLSQATEAIRAAVQKHSQENLAYLVYETQIGQEMLSADGRWAVAWLTPVDPQSNEVIPTEPGLAIARQTSQGWQVLLPADDGWSTALVDLPEELISDEIRESLIEINTAIDKTLVASPLTGYHLPWEAGKKVWLSQSVAHDRYTPSGSAHYAFDFYIHDTMFNIHAAKAGKVYRYKDTVDNNNHDVVNYLVLEDISTIPVTYQLYLHLAQNSIPDSLKVIGAPVQQGQFIGIADNTGTSTGHHLHFQVETQPSVYWSQSLDVVFDEVTINGGRPRMEDDFNYCNWPGDVCDVLLPWQVAYFISDNTVTGDRIPPVGDLTTPADLSTIASGNLVLSGWASDADSGLKSAQLIAYYENSWHNIGQEFTGSPFTYNWNLCADNVPDGPVSLALRLRDKDGNYNLDLPGLRQLMKNYPCPAKPPVCTPTSNQVALFADPDYQGACVVMGNGSYTSISNLGANNAESIQVGAGVLATLYDKADLTGRSETISTNDSNLSDNRTGKNHVSSLRVQSRTSQPATPNLVWPANGFTFRANSSLVLTWEDAGGGTSYEIKLTGPSSQTATVYAPVFSPGSLQPGNYSWMVRSINSAGASSWSSSRTFVINPPAALPAAQPVPYASHVDTNEARALWVNSGNWDWTNITRDGSSTSSWAYDAADATAGYNTGDSNYGDLTSPPFAIPSGSYYLRFLYMYETEGPGVHWDRRFIQISKNNGPFENVYQFSEDPPNHWQQSPVMDLSSYANSIIQVRFHFETVDTALNEYLGWLIDDFSINTQAPPACSDTNNTPGTATQVTLSSTTSGVLCPAGDMDYYRFSGQAGDQIGISALATAGSPVDTYLYLLDSDGKSVLAENDDMVTGTRTDSALSYRLPRSGTYYIKVRAWAYPSEGGLDHTYSLQTFKESVRPGANISAPPGSTFLSSSQTTINAQVSDTESGVSHVDFFWHSGDWQTGSWEKISSDWDGSDGWQATFDAQSIPDQLGMGFYIHAVDWAGNQGYAGIWHMGLDRTPPVSSITTIPSSLNSTVIPVQWQASDNLSGIDHFDLMRQTGTAAWENWALNIPGADRHLWVIAEPGRTYGFKLRAIDRIGNTEAYTSQAEQTVSIPTAVCTAYDTWETAGSVANDNTPAHAIQVNFNNSFQIHNFCNPAAGGGFKDEDWLRISVKAGQVLYAHSQPIVGSAAAILELYAEDGTTLLVKDDPGSFDQTSHLGWFAENNRTLYLRVRSIDDRVAGDLVKYQLSLQIGLPLSLPAINSGP